MAPRQKPLRIQDPPVEDLGPAMLALEPKQRRFVIAYLGDQRDLSRCAAAAGYSTKSAGHRVMAHRLINNDKVIDAIKEHADKTLNSNAFIAASALREIASDRKHKDRYKAAASILDRTGFPTKTVQDVKVDMSLQMKTYTQLVAEILPYFREHCPSVITKRPFDGGVDIDVEKAMAFIKLQMLKAGDEDEVELVMIEHSPDFTGPDDIEETEGEQS